MGCGGSNLKMDYTLDDGCSVNRANAPHDTYKTNKIKFGNNQHETAYHSWTPNDGAEKPVGIVCISHGVHEHGLRYYSFAHQLTKVGYVVYAIDHVSHGGSGNMKDTRGYIENYQVLIDDFYHFIKYVKEKYDAKTPCFVFAHSMGSLVGTLTVQKKDDEGNPLDISAIILSGLPIAPGVGAASPFGVKSLYPVTKLSFFPSLVAALTAIAPKGDAAPIIFDAIVGNEAARESLRRDLIRIDRPLYNKTAYELVKMIEVIKTSIPSFNLPFYALHGKGDGIALPEGSEQFYNNACTPAEEKRLSIIPDALHEWLHESMSEEYVSKVIEYFDAIIKSKTDAGSNQI